MSDELRTLKDLSFTAAPDEGCTEYVGCCAPCCKRLLRQEAIKWIKSCRNSITDRHEFVFECNDKIRCPACSRFIEFFNISEEELQ